jgi:lysophospholipase L1-like esterase
MAKAKKTVRRTRRIKPSAELPNHSHTVRWNDARDVGIAAAERVLARRRARIVRAAAVARPGTLVAEGDSWFSYPLSDVLEELEDRHGWDVVSVAHAGDRVEAMAYEDGQLSKLERALRKVSDEKRPLRAVLLSGGGNDIAGDEFAMLLNHKQSGLPPLNARVVAGLFEERLRAALISLVAAVTTLCRELFDREIPIVLHGYDRPVPDGRGFLGGFLVLPGPWLEPGFRRKGFVDLAETTDLMSLLIDAFNAQLATIAGGPGLTHVHYLDLRGTLSNELAGRRYQQAWANELHPTGPGFQAVADRFDIALKALP